VGVEQHEYTEYRYRAFCDDCGTESRYEYLDASCPSIEEDEGWMRIDSWPEDTLLCPNCKGAYRTPHAP